MLEGVVRAHQTQCKLKQMMLYQLSVLCHIMEGGRGGLTTCVSIGHAPDQHHGSLATTSVDPSHFCASSSND